MLWKVEYWLKNFEGEFLGFLCVRYLPVLHLPPLRLLCVGECWDGTQCLNYNPIFAKTSQTCVYKFGHWTVATLAAWHWQSKALATQLDLIPQSTYLPEYHGVCPSSQLGPPHPLSRKRVCPPLGTKVGGDTRLRVRGWESPNLTTEKKLVLRLLCVSSQHLLHFFPKIMFTA
jgi:hypothetical protein